MFKGKKKNLYLDTELTVFRTEITVLELEVTPIRC